jgi:hypothetical protein
MLPLTTGQGSLPLLALKLSEETFPSADNTNLVASFVPALGAIVPVFAAFLLWPQLKDLGFETKAILF